MANQNIETLKKDFINQGLLVPSIESLNLIHNFYDIADKNPADYNLENWSEEKLSHSSEFDEYLNGESACFEISNGFYLVNSNPFEKKR